MPGGAIFEQPRIKYFCGVIVERCLDRMGHRSLVPPSLLLGPLGSVTATRPLRIVDQLLRNRYEYTYRSQCAGPPPTAILGLGWTCEVQDLIAALGSSASCPDHDGSGLPQRPQSGRIAGDGSGCESACLCTVWPRGHGRLQGGWMRRLRLQLNRPLPRLRQSSPVA